MHFSGKRLIASPTDLANFLVCKHKTALDLRVAAGELKKPEWVDPLAEQLQKRGEEHEARYVETLRAQGKTLVDLRDVDRAGRVERTKQAIAAGADAIIQAALETSLARRSLGEGGWSGYADVLIKVAPGRYEAQDTKLARETKGGTILQLCVYTDLLSELQGGVTPEHFHVVTPVQREPYRFADFGAFYRGIKARFSQFAGDQDPKTDPSTYPEPTDHCEVCRWSPRCNGQRRKDDHLSFVHGLGRIQRAELAAQGITKLAELAAMPVPLTFVPNRGSKETYERLQDQARLQLEQRNLETPVFDCLPIEKGFGLCALPEPRPGDLFLDLEGDPFGRAASDHAAPGATNREYLFGLGRVHSDGSFDYTSRWSCNDAEEHAQFDATMADIIAALDADPSIHVYHYAPYEPTAFKRLMGRYATREADVDKLLRGRRFVDLYAIVRHAVRAGVESYSIKSMEPFYAFQRTVELDEAGDQRRLVEVALESGDFSAVTPEVRANVEGYNKDDVISTAKLRDWLEKLRAEQIAKGIDIPRPEPKDDQATEPVKDRQRMVNELRTQLLAGVPNDRTARSDEQHARYLLAYLLDWHYREDKVAWWEYFRILGLDEPDLWDEPNIVCGLEFVERLEVTRRKDSNKPTGTVVDRYRYPAQECEIRRKDKLKLRDERDFGEVVAVDRRARTLDIKKTKAAIDLNPWAVYKLERVNPDVPAKSLWRLADRAIKGGNDLNAMFEPAIDLLLRRSPADIVAGATGSVLPIQGPPGAGKTYTGAAMIGDFVRSGKRVGVTATSHKVIRNLLDAVAAADDQIRIAHKVTELSEGAAKGPTEFAANEQALTALRAGAIDVLGGTAWLWSAEDFAGSVDVLFVDEAGQMSLANVLAASQAAPRLVLLGDPQQLEQPQKGSHPDGVDVSSLEHVLDGAQTMAPERGRFLPETWRLAPRLCEYTSEVFYENKLEPVAGLERQVIHATNLPAAVGLQPGVSRPEADGIAGLMTVLVDHIGNRNASTEEAAEVVRIVSQLLAPGATWTDRDGVRHQMTASDIRVITPFNAQVARIQEALEAAGRGAVAVGTVDKFQGQEAAVAIYSLATSHPDDAPRGMEFLYSLNRLNVATSRARCLSIVVASPRLFEPDCQTPRRMRLASALGRVRERAHSGS